MQPESQAVAEKQDVDKLKLIMKEVDSIIELGIEIGKGGVGKEDVIHIPAVIEKVRAIIELSQHFAEAKAEFKDIDASEVGELLIAAWSEVQDKG